MHEGVYFASLSCRTLVYKGMLTGSQLPDFFIDLHDDRVESAIALVHARFSTNTFPMWPLAHPYRMIAHNGEINTIQGNRNFMSARESLLATDLIPDLDRTFPVCTPGVSDTAGFDEVLELLYMGGYSLPEAVLMMIPEPWEKHESLDPAVRDFYRYHASLMEPWDGPASIAFTDGRQIGAVLDRNGLRPSRYLGQRRRPGGHGLRGGRHRRAPITHRREGPAPSRKDVPGRHHQGSHRPEHRDQTGPGNGSAPTQRGWATAWFLYGRSRRWPRIRPRMRTMSFRSCSGSRPSGIRTKS